MMWWNNRLGSVFSIKFEIRAFSHKEAKSDYNLSSPSLFRVLMASLELRESRVSQDTKVKLDPLDPKDHQEHPAQW